MDAAREEDKHGGGRSRPAGIGPKPRIALSVSDQLVRRVGKPKDLAPPGKRPGPACRARCFGRPLPPRTLRLEVHDQRERQGVVRLLQRDVNAPGP